MIGNSGRYIRFVFLSLCFVTIFSASAWAGFTKIDTNLPGVFYSTAAWGDYDNDGDLDAIIAGGCPGEGWEQESSYIARNDGNGVFTVVDGGFGFLFDATGLVFGDYDNDGDLDLLSMWLTGARNRNCRIYRNDGGKFTLINTPHMDLGWVQGTWGDYDNDGDLDVMQTGSGWESEISMALFRNDGNDTFTKIFAGLPYTAGGMACGDYDNDGDLDVLLSSVYVRKTRIYRNDGHDTFTQIDGEFILDDSNSIATWADYDNDGDLDILTSNRIYRNDGNDAFTTTNINLSHGSGPVSWGDFDNNGYLDLLKGDILYLNNGNDTFTEINTGLTQFASGTVVAGDYDNDGDLDILLIGGEHSGIIEIWRNDGGWDGFVPNTPPTAPTNLQHNENAGRHILFWDPSFDNQTPTAGLSYNIRIGTSPDKMDILSPMSDGATGWRKVPVMGNTGPNPFFMFDGPMPAGTAYYWQVQAVDTAFAGSEWSELSWFGDSETLVVKKNGNGSGTVTSDLAGIDCGGECGSEFPINGTITLTAVADAHSEFIGWCGGDCHGTGTCTVTMDQSRTVLATFIKKGPGWWGGWHHRPHYMQWLNWWRHHWTRPWNHHYVWWGGWRRHLPH